MALGIRASNKNFVNKHIVTLISCYGWREHLFSDVAGKYKLQPQIGALQYQLRFGLHHAERDFSAVLERDVNIAEGFARIRQIRDDLRAQPATLAPLDGAGERALGARLEVDGDRSVDVAYVIAPGLGLLRSHPGIDLRTVLVRCLRERLHATGAAERV